MADLDLFVSNHGLKLIGRQIFQYLDIRSLVLCTKVSKKWKNFILSEKWVKSKALHQIESIVSRRKSIIENRLRELNQQDITEQMLLSSNDKMLLDIIKTKVKLNDLIRVVCFLEEFWLDVKFRATSLFQYLCLHNQDYLVELLLTSYFSPDEAEKNVSYRDGYERNSLHFACINGRLDIVKTIVDFSMARPDIDLINTDNDEKTPLHLACEEGNTEIVKFLLENHASSLDLEQSNFYFYLELIWGPPRIPGLRTPLHLACQNGHFEVVKAIFDFSLDTNQGYIMTRESIFYVTEKERTPLHCACYHGHKDIVELLLEHPNVSKADISHEDMISYNPEIVDILIKHQDK